MSTVSCLPEGGLHGEDRERKRCWVIKSLHLFLMVKSKSRLRTWDTREPLSALAWRNLPCKCLIGHGFNHSIEGKDNPVHHPADLEVTKAFMKHLCYTVYRVSAWVIE